MGFIYLKKLADNKTINNRKIEGVKEKEILQIEQKLKIKFPASYKEFLLLAGAYSGGLQLADGHNDLETLANGSYLEFMHNQLKKDRIEIKRPFWVFSEADGFQQFYFFYLDENTEDPAVYGVTYRDENESYIYPLNQKFSEFISNVVDKSLLYAKRGY